MYAEPFPIGEPRRGRGLLLAVGLLLALAGPATAGLWLHNGLVAKREAVEAAWAQVQSNYQRRADLVPVLVESVERHMRHESETLERVVEQRNEGLERFAAASDDLSEAERDSARILAALGSGAPEDARLLEQVAASQARLTGGIRQLLALTEGYPELRAGDSFLELQAQLEGSENRINVARMGYNEAVRDYNAALEKLPTRAIAQARGFERRAYFETDPSVGRAAPLGFD